MSEAAACPNCARTFAEPRPRFCPACGQETNVKPPTLMEFAQQFGGAYFSTEGALWRTLKLLVLRPGELTRQYLAGRRKHYVLPLRLYLTMSLAVVATLRIATPAVSVNGDPDASASASVEIQAARTAGGSHIEIGPVMTGVKDGVFHCTGLPESVCRRVKRRFDVEPKVLERELQAFSERFVANLGGALFCLVPAFALWMKAVYANRQLRYTEHLVFALHLHAFWFPALALLFTGSNGLALLSIVGTPIYTLAAMKRVYGGRWWPLLLRATAVFLMHLGAFAAAMGAAALWSLLF